MNKKRPKITDAEASRILRKEHPPLAYQTAQGLVEAQLIEKDAPNTWHGPSLANTRNEDKKEDRRIALKGAEIARRMGLPDVAEAFTKSIIEDEGPATDISNTRGSRYVRIDFPVGLPFRKASKILAQAFRDIRQAIGTADTEARNTIDRKRDAGVTEAAKYPLRKGLPILNQVERKYAESLRTLKRNRSTKTIRALGKEHHAKTSGPSAAIRRHKADIRELVHGEYAELEEADSTDALSKDEKIRRVAQGLDLTIAQVRTALKTPRLSPRH